MSENTNSGTESKSKGGFLSWLDNFWYHYKWHSLIALFLVFTVTVCTLQMCQRESYDIHILYAGNYPFSRQSADGDMPEYNKAKKTLSRFVTDYDDNGEVNLSFRDLFLPSADEMKELGESEYSRAFEDRTSLSTLMTSSEYYLCFMSPSVYESYKDPLRLMNLKALFSDLSELEFYDESGMAVKLSCTAFYTLSGFSSLPEDTVVCLRSTNFSSHLDKKSNEAAYKRAEETLRKILSYSLV